MRYKVKKNILILITGFIWLLASFMLLHRAYTWIDLLSEQQLFITIIISVFIAIIKVYLIFYKLTKKNIERIANSQNKYISIFKFHLLRDQILIIVMILAGVLLRNLLFIPKAILMPIYIGIGIAMFFSASLYFKYFLRNLKGEQSNNLTIF